MQDCNVDCILAWKVDFPLLFHLRSMAKVLTDWATRITYAVHQADCWVYTILPTDVS